MAAWRQMIGSASFWLTFWARQSSALPCSRRLRKALLILPGSHLAYFPARRRSLPHGAAGRSSCHAWQKPIAAVCSRAGTIPSSARLRAIAAPLVEIGRRSHCERSEVTQELLDCFEAYWLQVLQDVSCAKT